MRAFLLWSLFGLFCFGLVGTIGVVMVGLYHLTQTSFLLGAGGVASWLIVLLAYGIQEDARAGRRLPRFLSRN